MTYLTTNSICWHECMQKTVGPTTDQINWYCPDCGASRVTFPTTEERSASVSSAIKKANATPPQPAIEWQRTAKWGRIYDAASRLMAAIGYHGERSSRDSEVLWLNECLKDLDGGQHIPGLMPSPVVFPAPQPVAAEVEKYAARYRWLRGQNWDSSMLCVVRDPIKNLRLGADCPSLIRLDEFIDNAMDGTGSDESAKEAK